MHQHQKTNESLEWSERNATRQSIIFLHFFAVWSWPNFFLCSCILFFCKNFDQKLPFPPSLQHSLAACPPLPSILLTFRTTLYYKWVQKVHQATLYLPSMEWNLLILNGFVYTCIHLWNIFVHLWQSSSATNSLCCLCTDHLSFLNHAVSSGVFSHRIENLFYIACTWKCNI